MWSADAQLNGSGAYCSLTDHAYELGPLAHRQKWSQALNGVPSSDLYIDMWNQLPRWIHQDARNAEGPMKGKSA